MLGNIFHRAGRKGISRFRYWCVGAQDNVTRRESELIQQRSRTSLVVQWLRLCTFTTGGTGSIPGGGTKIPQATGVSQNHSCPTFCNPVDCSPLGSSVHGSLQAGILEWVAIPFSRGSSWPRDWTQVSWIVGRFFTVWATRKPWGTAKKKRERERQRERPPFRNSLLWVSYSLAFPLFSLKSLIFSTTIMSTYSF